MSRVKTVHRCSSCGQTSAKWLGRCPGCSEWNTLTEEHAEKETKGANEKRTFRLPEAEGLDAPRGPIPLARVAGERAERRPTGIAELDRVLGGGLVPGALILVGGDPGIGKSTLLLHALDRATATRLACGRDGKPSTERGPALYVTGEESPEQVKLRADRLGIASERVLLLAETRADRIVRAIEETSPSVVVIDSVQAVYDPELESAPGSVSQIREVSARFLYLAKARGVAIFLVGHVTKDGALAGPRVLEHLVDSVLYFESSNGQPYRILRAHKNRFGSTNEIGVFEMQGHGLIEVPNPSELFLAERPKSAPGSVVLPTVEGSRPVLVEVQALASRTNFGTPRRTCLGFDPNRAALLVAVLERRAGLELLGCDVFLNVAGGIELDEPAADLAVCAALASSLRNRPLATNTIVFGEVGLAGELRAVSQPEARLVEGQKLGFVRAIVPKASTRKLEMPQGIEVVGVATLEAALDALFSS